jgi:hypothetical protein
MRKITHSLTYTHVQVMLRQLAMGGGPKQVQARLEKELKEEFGDLPREELRKVIRERMVKMNERDAAMMLEKSGEQVCWLVSRSLSLSVCVCVLSNVTLL